MERIDCEIQNQAQDLVQIRKIANKNSPTIKRLFLTLPQLSSVNNYLSWLNHLNTCVEFEFLNLELVLR